MCLKTNFFRCVLACYLLLICYLATTSGVDMPVRVWDKLKHFGTFFVLSALIVPAFPSMPWLQRCLVGFAFGGLIELIQYFLPSRSASGLDLFANTVGIVAFEVLYWIKRKLV